MQQGLQEQWLHGMAALPEEQAGQGLLSGGRCAGEMHPLRRTAVIDQLLARMRGRLVYCGEGSHTVITSPPLLCLLLLGATTALKSAGISFQGPLLTGLYCCKSQSVVARGITQSRDRNRTRTKNTNSLLVYSVVETQHCTQVRCLTFGLFCTKLETGLNLRCALPSGGHLANLFIDLLGYLKRTCVQDPYTAD